MRIGFDIDGTLADFHTAILRATQEKYGEANTNTILSTEASVMDRVDENFWFKLKALTPKGSLAYDLISDTDIPLPDVKDYRFFITRRPPCLQSVTARWLRKHFGFNDRDVLITGAVEKHDIVKGLLLDRYYDDCPIHLLQMSENRGTELVLVSSQKNQWFLDARTGPNGSRYMTDRIKVI